MRRTFYCYLVLLFAQIGDITILVNKKCTRCGGKLRRVHRTFIERFSFMAKYRCRACQGVETAPRRYQHHFGGRCRCPRCGTYRITKLKERDKIDKMETG